MSLLPSTSRVGPNPVIASYHLPNPSSECQQPGLGTIRMMDYWTLLAPFIQDKLRAYQLRRGISRCGKSLIQTSTPQERGRLDASPHFAFGSLLQPGLWGSRVTSTQSLGEFGRSHITLSNGVVRLNLKGLFDVRQWRCCEASTGRGKPEIWRIPDEGEIVPRESRELVN
jgi:hypothetical protein